MMFLFSFHFYWSLYMDSPSALQGPALHIIDRDDMFSVMHL